MLLEATSRHGTFVDFSRHWCPEVRKRTIGQLQARGQRCHDNCEGNVFSYPAANHWNCVDPLPSHLGLRIFWISADTVLKFAEPSQHESPQGPLTQHDARGPFSTLHWSILPPRWTHFSSRSTPHLLLSTAARLTQIAPLSISCLLKDWHSCISNEWLQVVGWGVYGFLNLSRVIWVSYGCQVFPFESDWRLVYPNEEDCLAYEPVDTWRCSPQGRFNKRKETIPHHQGKPQLQIFPNKRDIWRNNLKFP